MLKCDKMFIKFDKEHFKLLVPDTIPINDESTTFTSKIESNSIETSEFSFSTIVRKQTRIKRTRKPKTTKVPETEETGISLIAIILIIVGILIFFSSIISIIIWLFVFRGNNKEEEKEQLPQINSTQPTNTNSETTNVNDNPSFSLNEAKDDSPANVVQTQMDFENSKIIGGVEVPETKVETEEDEVKEEEDNI
ncbi:hypothetical protein Mgra_00008377 [Meloidogyne graminicola]|uniref:Uncharacterized protein n=1 Tax=Meloidogyne graminicola TaxID=189291 RepID=A0A8S9ZFX8_9BILA|nr:hypothetical protein Mgra_00008377 [Meloidogyne graminicola]